MPLPSGPSSLTPGRLNISCLSDIPSAAFYPVQGICPPDFGISGLNKLQRFVFGPLARLPTLKLLCRQNRSKANYRLMASLYLARVFPRYMSRPMLSRSNRPHVCFAGALLLLLINPVSRHGSTNTTITVLPLMIACNCISTTRWVRPCSCCTNFIHPEPFSKARCLE